MSNIKRVFKLFFVWQESKEEEWLNEMAQKGWLLDSYFIGLYTFIKSEPANYIYKFDYCASMNIDKDEYITIFKDAGWEHVTEFIGWHYFRIKTDQCKYPDIYSDNRSKIQKYQGLLKVLLIVAILNSFNFINLFFLSIDRFPYRSFSLMSITRVLIFLVLGLLVYAIYRTFRTIKKLKDEL